MGNRDIIQKVWSLCNILRGDGISYHEYVSELTYLLFLKIAEETGSEDLLLEGCKWCDLIDYDGDNFLVFYQDMLTKLGGHADNEIVRAIYSFPTTIFSHSENLKEVIERINKLDWHSVSEDDIGQIYEGLLAKNSEDARSGAGQYFTPRPLVNCIIKVMQPDLGEVIQDPATGTGGFLIAADNYVRAKYPSKKYVSNPPCFEGMEIERDTYRHCLMNTFWSNMQVNVTLGDALTLDVKALQQADLILANPPFGSKSGSARKAREDLPFPTANKQLAFVQHIYLGLKPGGRAAVVLPDNVLFEDNTGKQIRRDLMDKCRLHTILRLPTGIFYAQGVKTNVLFFERGTTDKGNTDNVWVYDLRTNMPKFGKRTPLLETTFADFVHVYGDDVNGTSPRKEGDCTQERWKCFTRDDIEKRGDNLDITWLKDESAGSIDDLPEPDEIAAKIMNNLKTALAEMEALTELLDTDSDDVEAAQ